MNYYFNRIIFLINMKQTSQVNITHSNKQLHYMIELNDTHTQLQTTHGFYNYFITPDYIQFVKNSYNQQEYDSYIYNMQQNINTWSVVDKYCTNYYIPLTIEQRCLKVYIPRYSIESFYENNFSNTEYTPFSNIKYIVTSYIYIAGTKIILGSYMFDIKSALASDNVIHHKGDEYYMCVDFDIIDPIPITYNDEWKDFRVKRCGELPYTNNTGSVIHIELEPVIESSVDGEYVRIPDFTMGETGLMFQKETQDFMNLSLDFNGDATLKINFNEVFEDDLTLYLAETYNMWKMDDEGNYLDENGEIVQPDPHTGIIDEEKLVPTEYRVIYELAIKDEENIYDIHTALTEEISCYTFDKTEIWKDWDWWKEGLIMQGSIEIYETDLDDVDKIRETLFPIIVLMSNEVPLTQETFKYLTPTQVAGELRKINIDDIDMNNYNVSIVNKIHKNIVKVNRPEDYKANILRPVFYSVEPLDNITVHPAVNENIGINLNRYKSKVELFYIRIEGQDFVEIGRTKKDVIFNIDGNKLPNEVDSGIYYILNEKFELVTTGNYTYEQ